MDAVMRQRLFSNEMEMAVQACKRLLVVLAWMLAVYVVASTLVVVSRASTMLPYWDQWGFVDQRLYTSLSWWFSYHNEHRLVLPRLFFLIDLILVEGRNTFLLVSILVLTALHVFLLLRLAGQAVPILRYEWSPVAAFVVASLFSAMQFTNLVWGFQVQFVLVYLCASGAVVSLVEATLAFRNSRPPWVAWVWVIGSGVLATMATYSMANGVFVWPIVIGLAVIWAQPSAVKAVLTVWAVSVFLVYFVGFQGRGVGVGLMHVFDNPGAMIKLPLLYVGLPWGQAMSQMMIRWGLVVNQEVREWLTVLIGSIGAGLLVLAIFRAGQSSRAMSPSFLALGAIALFVLMSFGATAFGRYDFTVAEVLTWTRYNTPALVFWAVMLLIWTVSEARINRGTPLQSWNAIVFVAILATAVLALHQPVRIAQAKVHARNLYMAETAIATGVFDESAWKRVYPEPRQIISRVDLLRHDRRSIFSTKWPYLFGKGLNTLFKESDSKNCLGNFDALYVVPGRGKLGYRATGWAWDRSPGTGSRYVILVAEDGAIVGLAKTGFIRKGVKVIYPEVDTDTVGWKGHVVAISSQNVAAYLVQESERAVCKLGTVKMASSPLLLGDLTIEGQILNGAKPEISIISE